MPRRKEGLCVQWKWQKKERSSAALSTEVVDGLRGLGSLEMGEAVVLGLGGGGVGCAAETLLSTLWLFLLLQLPVATPSPDARRLYDDLLSNYNR